MTIEQQEHHFERMINKMAEVMMSKGNDYANYFLHN